MKRVDGRIELEHFYPHPVARVWRALTDPELHAKWSAPGDIRPVEGHCFELDMGRWGKQPCRVLEVQWERRFRLAFATETLDTTITWELSAESGGTRLRLVHEGFDLDSPLAKAALEGMGNGWPKLLERLGDALDEQESGELPPVRSGPAR